MASVPIFDATTDAFFVRHMLFVYDPAFATIINHKVSKDLEEAVRDRNGNREAIERLAVVLGEKDDGCTAEVGAQ